MDTKGIDFKKPSSVYFMGIGGISMSGLAEILHQAGFTVSGSAMQETEIFLQMAACWSIREPIQILLPKKFMNWSGKT